MTSRSELQSLYRQLSAEAARSDRNDPVANALRRVQQREADDAFAWVDQFYHPFDTGVVTRGGKTRTQVVLLKPVGDHCNLRCTYCYEIQRLQGSHEKVMSTDMLRGYLENILGNGSSVSDIFIHGGEPLLAGLPFFRQFIEILRAMGRYESLSLGVQTNATLLDEEWIAFFKEHGFHLGISLDGDRAINDRYRIDHKGRGSYDKVVEGIRLLQRHGIEFGVISVVSTETAREPGSAARILEHHVGLGLKYIDIHPAFTPKDTSGDSAECNLSREEYARFMGELAEAWIGCSEPDVHLRCMEDLLQNLSEVKSNSCYAAGLCTSIVGIDPSGAVSPCTRPFRQRYVFGNMGEMTLEALEQTRAYQQFVADEQQGQALTRNCEWADLCGHGNCPHERFTQGEQDPAGRHFFCSCGDTARSQQGYPGFYQRFFAALQRYHARIERNVESLL
jgi:uncharacterized protein